MIGKKYIILSLRVIYLMIKMLIKLKLGLKYFMIKIQKLKLDKPHLALIAMLVNVLNKKDGMEPIY